MYFFRYIYFPKQCLHNGVLTFRVKELVADRSGARGGGTGPWFRRSRCGFARIPLRFDAPAVASREFCCISMLPLWFRANSGLSWPLQAFSGGPLRLPTATARAVGRGLGFDAPAVVSREFRCVSMLPLWFRANSVAFRCSRCGFARIPASRGLFRPLLGGPLRLPTATARAVSRGLGFDAPAVVSRDSVAFRCCRCGFARIPLHFDAPAVVSREFRPRQPLLGGPLRLPTTTARAVGRGLCFDAPAVLSREFRCVSVVSREFRPLQASSGGAT